jgi:Protein of unknown function (DUF3987)
MAFGDVYPKLWVLLIAPTTVFHKTTAMAPARRLARRGFPHLLAAENATPEALFSDLAGRQPAGFDQLPADEQREWEAERDFAAQRGLVRDELSGLLASAGRDYNAGLFEDFLKLYDCDELMRRSTRSQGRLTVRSSYLSLLGASTPAALAPHLQSHALWTNGWWPRFALLTPDVERPAWCAPADEVTEPPGLAAALQHLNARLPQATWPAPPAALTVALGAGVAAAWGRYNKALRHDLLTADLDERLYGTYGRLPVQALKVATLLAALDWPDGPPAPRIEPAHLARAVGIAERWRASAHRALALTQRTGFDAVRTRLLGHLGRAGAAGLTFRDLARAMRDKEPDALRHALRQLVDAGEVEPLDAGTGPKGGRPTERYRLPHGEVSTL